MPQKFSQTLFWKLSPCINFIHHLIEDHGLLSDRSPNASCIKHGHDSKSQRQKKQDRIKARMQPDHSRHRCGARGMCARHSPGIKKPPKIKTPKPKTIAHNLDQLGNNPCRSHRKKGTRNWERKLLVYGDLLMGFKDVLTTPILCYKIITILMIP